MSTQPVGPKVEWQRLECVSGGYLERAMVPGGWLVRDTNDAMVDVHGNGRAAPGYAWTSTLCFVPDPTHSWS